MKSSLKFLCPLLFVFLLALGSCKSSILHKDGMKEAVTTPIVKTIEKEVDKLKLNQLIESTTKLIDKIDTPKEESLAWRILPIVILLVGVVSAALIIKKVFKK